MPRPAAPADVTPSPRLSTRVILVWVGFFTAIGGLQTSYRWLDRVANRRDDPILPIAIEECTSSYGTLLLFPALIWWVRRVRRSTTSFVGAIAMHVPSLLAFSFLHTTWNATVRPLVFRIAGLGAYDYGAMPARYAMEFSIHVLLYAIFVTGIILYENHSAARAREARLARVEADLAEAQVSALQARLQPHFLFNALNTISSVMYTDPAAADTMLARLADLLRRTLRVHATEIPLRDELDMVRLWLSVMEARFGDRMDVRFDVADGAGRALVPPLILQPLLENALKHAEPAPGGTLHIAVEARRTDRAGVDSLALEVRDDGPGLRMAPEEAFANGVGLSTTRQRVRTLHGDAGAMQLELAPEGGLAVRLALPWREAADA